jgi:hypothetical protein
MGQGVSRWLRERAWVLGGDGGSACVRLDWACQGHQVPLVARVRLDARLSAFPVPVPPSTRGPKPKKGPRVPTLKSLVEEPLRQGHAGEGPGDGGERKRVRLRRGVCLWHTPGAQPVPIRWVLGVDPEGQ